MPQAEHRLNIAVFIDFDNIEIGVKTTLGEHFDVGSVLEAIKERGEVVTKIAYADWTRAGEYSRALTQHAIRLVQRNLTPGGDKNGADINLALDALEMAFTHPHINAYVIVGGDSDFLSLVEKLKQYDKKVFVVGGQAFTSVILQRNCHEFIAYENLTGSRRAPARGGRPAVVAASTPVGQAVPIVRRALKILADREVSPQTGLLKSTLLQLDSTFSERNYGASSFLDFVEKLAQTGVVTLKHAGRSVMVELSERSDDGATPMPDVQAADQAPAQMAPPAPPADRPVEAAPAGSAAEGLARAGHILASAAHARWPMYLRNVKQILRQFRDPAAAIDDAAGAVNGFDERRYGFGGLMDLLKGLQREGLVRMERDRRGGLRIFQGPNLLRAPQPARGVEETSGRFAETQPEDTIAAATASPGLPSPSESEMLGDPGLDAEIEAEAPGPIPVDTTAELLGRAKPKRTARARGAAAVSPRTARKPSPPKKATRHTSKPRTRKPSAVDTPGE